MKSLSYATRNWFARVVGLYRKNVTRYYAQTQFQRQVIADEGYPEDRIDVIPNMLDAPASFATWTPGSFVGFVGRLSEEKGVQVLLEAARGLPDVPFQFAGDPSSMPAGGSIPSNVTLRGQLAGEDLTRFYEDAAMIVAPSIWYEGFPSVIIEAMVHTRPVIASSIGGLPEIVLDGETGTTSPPGDVGALARAIRALWSDPARRRAYGEAGAMRVREQFSSQRYYERLMRTYHAATAAAHGEIHAP
jgi:glycosyltransferase involved in cell wall biosynthesis